MAPYAGAKSNYSQSFTLLPSTVHLMLLGHGATLHAAKIEDNVLVGMGATVLDGCVVRFLLPTLKALRFVSLWMEFRLLASLAD